MASGGELVLSIPHPVHVPIKMRLIPAGTFAMGSPTDEKHREDDEGPIHQVTIIRPFYMGIYEVTQAQWWKVMGTSPSRFNGRPNNPVEQVSWEDCQDFIARLNQMGLGTFRLPTEAEWEYACRAGTQARYHWGDDPQGKEIDDYAWHSGSSGYGTHPVGQRKPNAWGLFDMSGNVWEWCQDSYGFYALNTQGEPAGTKSAGFHVSRGGSWDDSAASCRSAVRAGFVPGVRDDLGFRLVRLVESE